MFFFQSQPGWSLRGSQPFQATAHEHLSPMNESFIADRWSTSVEAKSARVGMAIDFTGVVNH
jgi:hypothetical protein